MVLGSLRQMYIMHLASRPLTAISTSRAPRMSRLFPATPDMACLVFIRCFSGYPKAVSRPGPLEHDWAPVSARAVTCTLLRIPFRTAELSPKPREAWLSCITEMVTSRCGCLRGGCLTNWPFIHSRLGREALLSAVFVAGGALSARFSLTVNRKPVESAVPCAWSGVVAVLFPVFPVLPLLFLLGQAMRR